MADDSGATDREEVHHEESDVNIRAIFAFGAGLAVVVVVLCLAIWGLFTYFDRRESKRPARYPLAAGQVRLPPHPRLQIAPRQDLQNLRSEEDRVLNSYGWVNKDAGTVRIPITDAMRLTVDRGLPARQPHEEER